VSKKSELTIYSRAESITNSAIESLERNLLILPGELADSLANLGANFVQVLHRQLQRGVTMHDLVRMSRYCNLTDRALRIIGLRGTPRLGEYSCNDSRTYPLGIDRAPITRQEWVRSNWESMLGSLSSTISYMLPQAFGFGCSVAEIVVEESSRDGRQVRLSKLKVLEIDRFEFAGYDGEIDRAIYYPAYNSPYPIPLAKLLIIYNPRIDNPNDLNGDPAIARAYPYYLARQLGYQAWGLAGQNQATGYPVYKARSEKNVQLLDRNGNPIRDSNGNIRTTNAVHALAQTLKNHESGQPIVLDKDVDVSSLNPGSGDAFFNTFLMNLQKQILYCYGLPSTILDDTQSGLGNASINNNHMAILDSQIFGTIELVRDQIIEKIVRPLSVWNFGADVERNLGKFVLDVGLDPATIGLQASNIMQGTMQGLLDPNDLDVVNRYRLLVGLPEKTREEFDRLLALKYANMQGEGDAGY
jgi:hypothetical protein